MNDTYNRLTGSRFFLPLLSVLSHRLTGYCTFPWHNGGSRTPPPSRCYIASLVPSQHKQHKSPGVMIVKDAFVRVCVCVVSNAYFLKQSSNKGRKSYLDGWFFLLRKAVSRRLNERARKEENAFLRAHCPYSVFGIRLCVCVCVFFFPEPNAE